LNKIKDDFNTVTAEDYTVNVDLSENEMFNKFYTDPKNRKEIQTVYNGSAVLAFRQYLIREIPITMAIYEYLHNWYVCYQDEGQEKMTWKNFQDEKGARESYEK